MGCVCLVAVAAVAVASRCLCCLGEREGEGGSRATDPARLLLQPLSRDAMQTVRIRWRAAYRTAFIYFSPCLPAEIFQGQLVTNAIGMIGRKTTINGLDTPYACTRFCHCSPAFSSFKFPCRPQKSQA